MVMDIVSSSSDEDSDNDTETGETVVVNKSQWEDPSDERDELTVTETEDIHRDNGEGPSRPPQASGGSPDDDGDDSDGDDSDGDDSDGDNSDGNDSCAKDSGYNSSDQYHDDEDDASVMPDIIRDTTTQGEEDEDFEHWVFWSMGKLQAEYRKLKGWAKRRIHDTEQEAERRVQSVRAVLGERIHDLRGEVDEHQATILERDEVILGLQGHITQLQLQIQDLLNRLNRIRPPPTPWTQLWQQREPYTQIYREACKQLNMSQLHTNVHPQLTISLRWLNHATLSAAYGLNDEDGNGNGNEEGEDNDSDNESELFVQQNPVPPVDQEERPLRPFNFDRLDRDIQERIFRYLFVKTDLVHCLSRLDPGNRPLTPRPLNRFFWGGNRQCVVSLAHRPNNVLRLLLVCKRWLYLGVHAFYGLNTFAFSSLGELGRFMRGIGSRMERIVNIELFWHGAVMPRHQSRINQRTVPLQFFCDTRRLRTLVIHIQERDEWRARRGYEKKEEDAVVEDVPYDGSRLDLRNPFKVMEECTRVQPNYRPNRSIRTLHGLDYIYQLRGMNYVRIREAQSNIAREPIRDWSVIDDINSVITRPKAPEYQRLSELPNLTSIGGIGEFVPSDDDMHIVRRWYADNEPMGSIVGEDDDGDTISIVSSEARSIPSLYDDEEDDESELDDDPDTPSSNGEGSGADVDIGDDDGMDDEDDARDKTPFDMDIDSGVEDMDMEMDDPVDDINEGLDQMDMRDDSVSTNTDAEESEIDNDDNDDDDDDNNNDGNDGNDGDSDGNGNDGDGNGDLDNGNEDHSRREWSSLFVQQNDDVESSLFVRSNRASTHFKTDSDEEKHKVIDLTGDDAAEVKEESSGSVIGSAAGGHGILPGSSRDAPMDVDEYDEQRSSKEKTDRVVDFSDAGSVSSSWKGGASSAASSSKRRDHDPDSYHGSDDASSPKRMRFNTPGSSRESAISVED